MAAPRIQGRNPDVHEGAVSTTTLIFLEVVDDDGNLVDSSVVLTVNGVVAWSAGAQQNSFVVTKTVVTNGNRYEITPPSALPDGPVSVRVEADDGINTLDETYHFFVNRVVLLDDHFGGIGITVQPGNGSISSSGGKLVTDSTVGQNLDWFTFGRNGTIGLLSLTNLLKPEHRVVYFETKLSSWVTGNTNDSHTLWGLYLNDQNFYWIFTADGLNWNAYKTVNNSWASQGSYPGNPAPALPMRIRFKWDRRDNTIAWQLYDSGWQDIVAAQTIAFTPTDVVYGHKTYFSLPAATSQYEELFIYAEEEVVDQRTEPAALQDRVAFSPESEGGERAGLDFLVGPRDYNTGIVGGVELPGPPSQQPGSVGPFDDAGINDEEVFPETPGPQHRAFPVARGFNIGGLADEQVGHILRTSLEDDAAKILLGQAGTYNDNTVDSDFNTHFTEKKILGAFFYNTAGEDWANPITSSLTGYARDGTRYTAGVQDTGSDIVAGVPNVVGAPWALEAFSVTRGNRDDFPEEALIVWTENAVTIFDVTNFPTNLAMWMRFTANTVNLVRVDVNDVKMVNGVMAVAPSGATGRRLLLIDFKGDTVANTAHLIGSDNHWRWNSDITTRNAGASYTTSGVSPSLRIENEDNFNLAMYKKAGKYWAIICGEDNTTVIEVDSTTGTVPSRAFPTGAVNKPADLGDIRNAWVDEFGWLWQSEQKRLVRNATQWQDGVVILEDRSDKYARGIDDRWPLINLPYDINHLVSARDYVYCGTDNGIYRVNRGTLEVQLAYTILGGGGGGRLNNPPDGEILLGDTPQILWLHAYNLDGSSYLSVATYQGVVTIRLYDDTVTQGLVFPALYEHRAYFNTSIMS